MGLWTPKQTSNVVTLSLLHCSQVGSALSDPYLSVAAGMNGLAGPLHGLANQVFKQFKFIQLLQGRE